jgi:hypothetical protein
MDVFIFWALTVSSHWAAMPEYGYFFQTPSKPSEERGQGDVAPQFIEKITWN